jgi:hypothetical protein
MGTIVNTKEELKTALKNKDKEILISNDALAKHVIKFKKIKKLTKWTLGVGLAGSGLGGIGVALAPTTGGASLLPSGALFAITTASGVSISTGAIIAIGALSILGSAILFALWKDYEVAIEGHGDGTIDDNGEPRVGGGLKVKLQRKLETINKNDNSPTTA